MSNLPVLAFNSGVLSPQIDTRSDVQKYEAGCRILENMIPRVYGSAERTPGTKYIADAKDDDLKVRMEDFIYSDTRAYQLEFGENYIRFYYNGGRVVGVAAPTAWATATDYIMGQFSTYGGDIYRCLVAHTSATGGGDGAGGEPDTNFTDWSEAALTAALLPICETPTPYMEDELFELQIRQIADTMWIVHQNYQPRKLTRTSTTTFDLSTITVDDGPFKKRNDLANDDDITIKPSYRRNHTIEGAHNSAHSSGGGVASLVSGSGVATGAIANVNDGNLLNFYRRTGTDTNDEFRSWVSGVAYFTAKITLDSATTITKIRYVLDWYSALGVTAKQVTCAVQQAAVWTTVATNVDTDFTVEGSWADVTAIRIYVYGKSGWGTTSSVQVSLNEFEAWGAANAVTLTASSATFNSSHIGALFKITHPRETTYVKGSLATTALGPFTLPIDVKGEFQFKTTGTWDMVIELQRNENNEGWEIFRPFVSTSEARLNVLQTYTEDNNNVQYRAYAKEATSGTCNATITVNTPTQDGIARITFFTSKTVVIATVIVPFASTDPSYRWYEGAWSNDEGWPGAFTFFEERACYGGTKNQPQTLWLSASGDYEKFDEARTPDSAFWVTMGSDKRNGIRWLSGLEALCIGTNGGEWRMKATSIDEQLTWENFDLKQQTSYGSKKIQPLAVGTAVLFVDTVGRKIREMTFVEARQKFEAPDLAALAEHITLGSITSIAFQKNPDFILWATLANGKLLCMVYERDQNVIAWSYHPLGGTGASCDSVCVTPSTNEDVVTLCVSRTVDADTVRHIEQIQPRVDVDLEDCWYVNDGLAWDGGDAVTITGITNASPGVFTAASHGFSDGDNVYISGIVGMTELNGHYYTIADATDDTFTLEYFEQVSSSASPS